MVMNRRTFLGLFFTSFSASMLCACDKKKMEILDTVYEIILLNQENTFLDDIIFNHEPLVLTTYHRGREEKIELPMVDAVNMLEKSIDMKEIFGNVDENLYNPLMFSVDDENRAIDLDYDTVEELVDIYSELDNENKMVISYLKNYYIRWYNNNGLAISKELLLSVLKNFGFQLDKAADDVIVEGESSETDSCIVVIKNNLEKRYLIDNDSGLVKDILDKLYEIQRVLSEGRDLDLLDIDCSKRNVDDINSALEYTKEGAIMEVISIEEDGVQKVRQVGIVNEDVLDYIKVQHK